LRRHAIVLSAPLLLLALLQTTSSPASWAAEAPATGSPNQDTASPPVSVRLPTGQRVLVSKVDGRAVVRFPPATAAQREPMNVISANGHTYVVPASVPGSAGRQLDLAAFDVSAKAFGQSAAPLGGTTASGSAATPADPFTVTVNGLNRSGQPANGDIVVLMNVDNSDTFIDSAAFDNGSASFVVPAGHYTAMSYIVTVTGDSANYTLVANPEFVVDQNVTVSLDARDGNRIRVRTPRRSAPVYADVNVQRDPAAGLSLVDSLSTFDRTPVYAAPTSPVKVGRLFFYQTQRRGDRNGSLLNYLYDLDIATRGVIPKNLKSVVKESDLATVQASYASVLPDRAEQESRYGAYPWQGLIGGGVQNLTAPSSRTEYVMAGGRLRWFQETDLDPNGGNGRTIGTVDIFKRGEHTTHVWNQQPMGSGAEQQTEVPQGCPVCRTASDTLDVALFPHVDQAGDFMLADSETTEQLTLYQDGTEIGSGRSGFANFPVSPDPASYRLQYDVDHEASWWPTSTHVSTSWSFTSAEGGTPVPPGWTCGGKGKGAILDDCFLQDLLLVKWATGAGLDGVVPAGTTAHLRVTVAPQNGLPADPIKKLTAKVSYDAGATWHKVRATTRADRKVWRLTYDQPGLDQTDGFASLRVTAHASTSGASVSQTIIHASPLGPLG
jgi:hypothetical protein